MFDFSIIDMNGIVTALTQTGLRDRLINANHYL